jgi:hypothetical protein
MMAGDEETGVSIMRVTEALDAGAVCVQEAEPIRPDDDYGTLAPRLEQLGARLLVQALDERPTPVEQDEALVTYAHRIGPRERALDPTQTPEQVERTIRALRPHIGSRLPLPDGSFLGVIDAAVDGPTRAPAGGLVRAEGERLLLDCQGGALELTEVRPPGGRPMAAADWLRGRPDPGLVNFRLDPTLPGRELDELVAAARVEWLDEDDEWKPHVCALAERGTVEVLHAMAALDGDPDPAIRELGAYVVGQLGADTPSLPAEQEAQLLQVGSAADDDPRVLVAVACGFGHLGEPWGEQWLLNHRAHPDAEVREAVAFALGGRHGDAALAALIELSRDSEAAVRDWATFALGTLAEQNSPALRDALAARLDDSDEDTRLEAIHGLALRGDHRADAPARDVIAHDTSDAGVWRRHLITETASHIDG